MRLLLLVLLTASLGLGSSCDLGPEAPGEPTQALKGALGPGCSTTPAPAISAAPGDVPFALPRSAPPDTLTELFSAPSGAVRIADQAQVVVPLRAGARLQNIELRFRDFRPRQFIALKYRTLPDGQWEQFCASELRALERDEDLGLIEISREPDHDAPYMDNPVRMRAELLAADGTRRPMTVKLIDPELSGPAGGWETDNLYSGLPVEPLAEGASLLLTVLHPSPMPWEPPESRGADFSWVKPVYFPAYSEEVVVFESPTFEPPPAEGYVISTGRKLEAVLVTWDDQKGPYSARVRLTTAEGTFSSSARNIGSGETELIAIGQTSTDGRLLVVGPSQVTVRRVAALYE